jgi:hypothetical protein
LLLRKGHRRIGFINLSFGIPAGIGRLEGYKRALVLHDVPFDEAPVLHGNSLADQGYDCARAMIQLADPPTALFCGNDRTAMGVYDALRDLHFAIPDDVAVVGFDNQLLIAAYLRPPLSTLQLPHYEMGRWGDGAWTSYWRMRSAKTDLPCSRCCRARGWSARQHENDRQGGPFQQADAEPAQPVPPALLDMA